MDPVSLIVAALAAGAVAGAQNTATDAVKDAYTGLKELVRRRLSGRTSGEQALAQHDDNPQQAGEVLEAELVAVGAGDDAADAAQRLMALLDPAGAHAGKYVVDMRGAQGVQATRRPQRSDQHVLHAAGGVVTVGRARGRGIG